MIVAFFKKATNGDGGFCELEPLSYIRVKGISTTQLIPKEDILERGYWQTMQ